MDGINQTSMRDANGRFVPGQSGNPAGKKQGTRNRATVLREALRDGEDKAAARIVIDRALAGDAVAARFIVGRLEPRPRGRAITLDLPQGEGVADILAASNATVAAMAAGEITPEEALTVTRVLDGRLRALKAAARQESGEAARVDRPRRPSTSSGRGVRGSRTARLAPAAISPRPEPVEGYGSRYPLAAPPNSGFRSRLLHSACILQPPSPGSARLAAAFS